MGAVSYWGVECNGGEFHPLAEAEMSNVTKPDVGTFSILCKHGGGEYTPQEFGSEHLFIGGFPAPVPGFKPHPAFLGKQTAA